jgi:threonylcarbamoyladenosine tRNA methylthiotransferase MtaB
MNPNAKIVVTGCYVEKDAEDISFLPGVEHIVKNSDKNRIADILNGRRTTPHHSALRASGTGQANDERRSIASDSLKISDFKDHTKAFVKIQDGCANLCSYCKVPLVRNHLKSKDIKDIVEEVEALVRNGFREIVLTGICLGAWGAETPVPGKELVDVLRAVASMKGDFRVRLSSIEPKYVTDELIDFIAGNRRFCSHLHIPLQSGDDDVLRKMNRPYTAEGYRLMIEKVISRIKDAALTTDVLIGFPGESDAGFSNTLSLVKEILPLRTHIFTFSKRKGTAAYDMEGGLDRDTLRKRYEQMLVASYSASYLYRKNFLNRPVNVLVESRRDRTTGLLTGYTDNYIKVHFEGPDSLKKRMVPVRITDLNLGYTLATYEPGPS